MGILTRLGQASMIAASILMAGSAASVAQGYPEREVTWVVPAGPGGGSDIIARTIVNIIQEKKLAPVAIVVENRPGGAGAIGYTYLASKEGDPYFLSSIAESFFTAPLSGKSSVNYENFTPVVGLASDIFLMISSKQSGIKSIEDMKRLGVVRVGTTGAATGSGFLAKLLEQGLGIEVRNVPFGSDGEVMSALIGGHVDLQFGNPAEVLGQIKSGDLVPIAVSSTERSPLLADVPTFKELGLDVELTMTRGMIMPKGVPAETVVFWNDVMRKVSETDEWKTGYVQQNGMMDSFMDSAKFAERLVELNSAYEANLKKVGVIK